ncbi:hypothetical protein DNTS_021119 [Danionella cerebrum]|uniref:Uncharacterized protein n=1 Tax=Danionella cerebrum TaxID=2873325 RepID=A0A553QVF4_9TELE|nr:hypothetical protein DNTS_021119 [Danionella translucida]TRY93966.1 hypothetical protein DNTS_021119 [Danionella translucida]
MSTPGYTNPHSGVNNYNMNSTQNGGGTGAAGACQNGPAQTFPTMHPASSYYNSAPAGYPPVSGISAPGGKLPVSGTDYSGNYYHTTSGPSPYTSPPGTHSSAHPCPTSNPPVQSLQQTVPYTMPTSYYGQPYTHPSHGQTQAQPSLVPASSGSNIGAPLYPIVSYPSAPGSSQYGTLRSSQTGPQMPGSTVMPPPPPPTQSSLQQYPQGNGAMSTHPSYGAPPHSQTAAVNGQTNAGILTPCKAL